MLRASYLWFLDLGSTPVSMRKKHLIQDLQKSLAAWDLYIKGLRKELIIRAPKTAASVRKLRADARYRYIT